jgi:tetratricopeptide (TPR) repeat protein
LDIADSTKIDFYIATMLGHVGNAYEKLNQFAMALNSFQKAIDINRKSSNNFLLTRNYISVATTIKNAPDPVLLEVGINPRMRNRIIADYYQEALLLNGESGELEVQRDALFGLSELYASQHEFGNALKYYKQYATIKDSIVNTENSKNIANLQLQFDSEKQEQQIVSLQKDKALHQTEILKQKTQRNVLMGGCMLAFLFIVILINGYVTKSKIGKKLEQTVVHLQTSQQQLIEQGKLAALGKMTADVALQIKEPIGLIKNLSPEGASLAKQYEFADTEIERSAILEKLKMDLSEIHRNGKRANDVVKDVLSQSRRNSG